MTNQYKAEFAYVICDMVAHDAITLPCECLSCNVHLSDHNVKNNKIKCLKCKKEFHVSNKEDFRVPHKILKRVLNN